MHRLVRFGYTVVSPACKSFICYGVGQYPTSCNSPVFFSGVSAAVGVKSVTTGEHKNALTQLSAIDLFAKKHGITIIAVDSLTDAEGNAINDEYRTGNNIVLYNAVQKEANGKKDIFFWNKKEAVSLLQGAGLQLPRGLPKDGFIHSIRENGTNINTKFENVTQSL